MPRAEQKAYIKAQQCVIKKPPKYPNSMKLVAKMRWDETVLLHQVEALQIHSTGTFLPFHRYFLHVQQFLLGECGYTGGLPYWIEALDAADFLASPLLDAVTGFGGDGLGDGDCVTTGPFAGHIVTPDSPTNYAVLTAKSTTSSAR